MALPIKKEEIAKILINTAITSISSMLILGFTFWAQFKSSMESKINSKASIEDVRKADEILKTEIDKKVNTAQYNELRELLLYNIKQTDDLKKYLMESRK